MPSCRWMFHLWFEGNTQAALKLAKTHRPISIESIFACSGHEGIVLGLHEKRTFVHISQPHKELRSIFRFISAEFHFHLFKFSFFFLRSSFALIEIIRTWIPCGAIVTMKCWLTEDNATLMNITPFPLYPFWLSSSQSGEIYIFALFFVLPQVKMEMSHLPETSHLV